MGLWSTINWNAVAAIAGAIATICALITVFYTINFWKEQERFNRPYFSITEPGIKKLPNSPPYRIQITFYNLGKRPATNFEGTIYLIDQDLKERPYQEIKFSVGNDIPINSPTPWYEDNLQLSKKMDPLFIVTKIKYADPITDNNYSQLFFMKWGGIINGTTSPDFTHVSIDEIDKIKKVLPKD